MANQWNAGASSSSQVATAGSQGRAGYLTIVGFLHRVLQLEAARVLLLRRGYTGATVDAIAHRAGISVQTVYNTVGGKAAVLKAVYDTALAGDDEPVPIMERPTLAAMRETTNARRFLALYARLGREMYARAPARCCRSCSSPPPEASPTPSNANASRVRR